MTAVLDTPLRPIVSQVAHRAPQGRFGQLMAQGVCYSAGTQLSNVSVVLPFIFAGRGMGWLAALLYPAYQIGKVIGNAASPCIVHRSGQHRHLLLAAAAFAMAVLIALSALVSVGAATPLVLLFTSALLGAGTGVANVASADVASSTLSDDRRGDLLLGQSAAGSLVATAVTLLVVPMLVHGDSFAQSVYLLWFGAAGMAAAGVAALLIGPVQVPTPAVRRSMQDTWRDGVRAARSQPWFRRYALTQLVFVPVSLGTTFYSLRAAHGGDKLPVLVVVASVALLTGSALWRAVYRAFGVRGMLVGSALMSTAAAAVCLVAELLGMWSSGWVVATVFLLATMANQAVYTASITWVGLLSDSCDRAALIGLGAALIAVASCVTGAVIGDIAQDHADSWPIVAMLVLSLVAVVVGRCAPAAGVEG